MRIHDGIVINGPPTRSGRFLTDFFNSPRVRPEALRRALSARGGEDVGGKDADHDQRSARLPERRRRANTMIVTLPLSKWPVLGTPRFDTA
jgi:hypothetical protein